MGRDDWKYFDYEGDDSDWAEERKEPPPERQCVQCSHWVPRESVYCPWCGKELVEDRRR
jgi:predicted amidophosphoribosyltransferase